ncbi:MULTISPECIES: DUF3572 domain-containing protein [Rhizobium]|uniref:DUF3572 family protein n=1 Tax=Rhizobium wenxiniae TaxID=1737357 RepID=A0A7W9Y4M9_9HYPH|nr:DUF3572 domain-containing protein [Rhizobium wenxiniae]MBB6161870.1 hypothetical protein [Rhizobium wenxiniae]GGF79417.1 hypothetical protein GCM10010924_02960 [Rhizobium wenxiniae]
MPPKTTEQDARRINAEETAAAVLGWMAGEPDMMQRFLALSGVAPDQIRSAISDPGFLAGVIDFIMSHEPTLLAFCEATGTKPETVIAAHQHYSGPYFGPGDY